MKVMVLTASVGSGHMRAAQGLEKALLEEGHHPRVVDVLTLANAPFRKLYGDAYLKLAESAPHVIGYLYDSWDKPKTLGDALRKLAQTFSVNGLRKMIAEERPDVVVHTHFLPAELVARLRRQDKTSVPHAVVVTDFDAHRLWAQQPCEAYFTASREAAASLSRWGVPAGAITVTGMPIDPVFAKPRRAPRPSRPMVLQMAGGSGLGPMEEIYRGLLDVERSLRIVVLAGRSETARAKLSALRVPSRHETEILGFTDRVPELLSQTDLLVTKPGGMTVSEALAVGVPVCVVNPIPGQEARNGDYLLERGAGVKIPSLGGLTDKVEALLADPLKLAGMRGAALKLGKPRAAHEIAAWLPELAARRKAHVL